MDFHGVPLDSNNHQVTSPESHHDKRNKSLELFKTCHFLNVIHSIQEPLKVKLYRMW